MTTTHTFTSTPFTVLSSPTPMSGQLHLSKVRTKPISTLLVAAVGALTESTAGWATPIVLTEDQAWDFPNGDPSANLLKMINRIQPAHTTMRLACTSSDVWNCLKQSCNLLKLLPLTHRGFFTIDALLEVFLLDGLLVLDDRALPKDRRAEFAFAMIDPDVTRLAVIRDVITIPE